MTTALASYMKSRDLDDAGFAAIVERDRSMVSKLRRGVLRPSLDLAAIIELRTDGAVTMQSWIESGEKDHDASSTAGFDQPSSGKPDEVSTEVAV